MERLLADRKVLGALAIVAIVAFLFGDELWAWATGPKSGQVEDEAQQVGRLEDTLVGADEDYFEDMDDGVTKDPQEVARRLDPFVPGISPDDALRSTAVGRNNWIVWSAGNDAFWDELSRRSFGSVDLLKTVSNHPELGYSRDNRWSRLGLVNEPCFEKGDGPREDRYGLYLDVHAEGCGPDPFENAEKYPGVAIGARGENIEEVGSYYGYGSGVVGLRLFPNPAFDAAAEAKWDAERYYTDPDYYNDTDLVRPYRVGMSCGYCHVGPDPSNPPDDPESPEWENLASNPGAQYFWVDRILLWEDFEKNDDNFIYQMIHTSRPGTLDTSFISSDNINNPRTMNAVYNLGARLENATRLGRETLADGGLNNAQFNDIVTEGPLTAFYKAPDKSFAPRVLKDGSDSVGALGALNRVYVNIGLFSEEWLLHFIPLVGGPRISPFEIEVARENSSFWRATEAQTPDVALFFLATTRPDDLADAPGGDSYMAADEDELEMGKEAFAGYCARCHSSKLPEAAYDFFPDDVSGPGYLEDWNEYWSWSKTSEFRDEMVDIVMEDDFLDGNFLSTELRIPVTLLETNACSPLATNSIEGNIWNDFSSRSYKDLPSVGTITVHHPLTGEPRDFEMPAGGRGYTRPASLVSLWTSAPYLLNNTVGYPALEEAPAYSSSGSVEDRMEKFELGIEEMLWPELRAGDRSYATAGGMELPGVIDRTESETFLRVSHGFLPSGLRRFLSLRERLFAGILPWVDPDDHTIEIGPIPPGTPINLLANLSITANEREVIRTLPGLIKHLKQAKADDSAAEVWEPVVDDLLRLSNCPDFVVNRGHYFGTEYLNPDEDEPPLSDEQKRALIEYLKTF